MPHTKDYSDMRLHISSRHKHSLALSFAIFLLMSAFAPPCGAGNGGEDDFLRNDSFTTALMGYGMTYPGWGGTRERVETVELVLRRGFLLRDEAGRAWYRNRHALLVELPVHYVIEPESGAMFGMNFLAAWIFTASKDRLPYVFVGGGGVYSDAGIRGMGSNINGNYQAGGGIHIKRSGGGYHNLEFRYHHISNNDTKEPNVPLNGTKLLLGITFF
jgi:hypothetical protein